MITPYNSIDEHPVKIVKQQHTTGCGIACIATLSGSTYEEVMVRAQEVLKFHAEGKFYTKTDDLVKLGAEFGINVMHTKRKPFKGYDALPDLAILSMKIDGSSYRWHWVVFFRSQKGECILDPELKIKCHTRNELDLLSSEITHWLGVELV